MGGDGGAPDRLRELFALLPGSCDDKEQTLALLNSMADINVDFQTLKVCALVCCASVILLVWKIRSKLRECSSLNRVLRLPLLCLRVLVGEYAMGISIVLATK